MGQNKLLGIATSIQLGSYVLFLCGVVLPVAHIWADPLVVKFLPPELSPDQDEVRRSYQTIQDLLKIGGTSANLTAFALVLFGGVVPFVKLALALISSLSFLRFRKCVSGHIMVADHSADQCEKFLRWARGIGNFVKLISRFQLVDAYAMMFTIAFINSAVMHAEALWGARCFFLYCTVSVFASQLVNLAFQQSETSELTVPLLEDTECASVVSLAGHSPTASNRCVSWLKVAAWIGFLVSAVGCFVNPILEARVTADSKRIVLETIKFDLLNIFKATWNHPPRVYIENAFLHPLDVFLYRTSIVLLLVVFPFVCPIVGSLIALVPLKSCSRISKMILHWGMPDVFALGVIVSFIAMGSINVIQPAIPEATRFPFISGFLWVLLLGTCSIPGLRQPALTEETQQRGGKIRYAKSAVFITAVSMIFGLLGFQIYGNAPRFVDLAQLNQEVAHLLPIVNKLVHQDLPSCVGNCTHYHDHEGFVEDCVELGSIYETKGKIGEVHAHWMSGLNSTTVDQIMLGQRKNRVVAILRGNIPSLRAWIEVKECLSPDTWFTHKCRLLWDNADACCSDANNPIKFNVEFECTCSDDEVYPLKDATLTKLEISDIYVHERLLAMGVGMNITPSVKERLSSHLENFVTGKERVPVGQSKWSVVEIINRIVEVNAKGNFRCPRPLMLLD